MSRFIQLLLAMILSVTVSTVAVGRGFGGGGFHGGGGGFDRGGGGGFDRGGGGGFHGGGGGFDRGGGGGFDRGGGGFDRGGGGFDRGGAGAGGFHGEYGGGGFDRGGSAGGFDRSSGGSFDRGGFNGGFHAGGFDGARPENFGGDRFGAGGFGAGGFRGNEFGGMRYGAAPSRGQLNSFLGMPTDAGLHAAAGAYGGRDFAAGRVGEGPRGIAGGVNGVVAGRGAVAGRGFAGINGTRAFSPTYMHAHGLAAQRWCAGRGWFTPGWNAGHPWAWYPGRWGAAGWTTAAWTAATWASLGTWFDWGSAPAYYDTSNVTYQDGNVYYGDQQVASQDAYSQQASQLASTAPAPANDADWMPLGIFAVVEGEQKNPSMTFQLAVDKQGVVRGNCIVDGSEKMTTVEGAVDKKTQRIAWTVNDAKTTVYETGLYNLTQQEAPGLVHFGKDRTEQVLLVRLKQDDAQPAGQN